ncbi:MAG: DUF6036 family nucleotidyltransferase [Acidimicrobiia bacterium]
MLVIGSQAAHGSILGDLPPEALRSIEIDIAAFDDPDGSKADLIDGAIGEASLFQARFSFYVQGVSQATAILPDGWRERLVRYETPATNGVAAWCLDLHDLWVSKALAGRPKDLEFCRAFLSRELVLRDVLRDRLNNVTGVPDAVLSKAMRLASWAEDA